MKQKQNLYNFDFSQFSRAEITKETLQSFRRGAGYLLPQILAFFGSQLKLRKNESGLYSPTYFIRDNMELCDKQSLLYEGVPVPKEILQGMIRILVHYPRGDILNANTQKQVREGIRFAANVPLVLSAFKEFRNVKYSEWDWSDPNISHLVDNGIKELIPYIVDENLRDSLNSWTPDDLLLIREEANTKDVPLTSLYTIAVTSNTEFKRLPRLLKLMLCQTWVYHPTVRNQYGICSVGTIDDFPEPLVNGNIRGLTGDAVPWISNDSTQVVWGGKRLADSEEAVDIWSI